MLQAGFYYIVRDGEKPLNAGINIKPLETFGHVCSVHPRNCLRSQHTDSRLSHRMATAPALPATQTHVEARFPSHQLAFRTQTHLSHRLVRTSNAAKPENSRLLSVPVGGGQAMGLFQSIPWATSTSVSMFEELSLPTEHPFRSMTAMALGRKSGKSGADRRRSSWLKRTFAWTQDHVSHRTHVMGFLCVRNDY